MKKKRAAHPKRKPPVKKKRSPKKIPKPVPQLVRTDLPFSYNETKLVLMARDPEWAYAYWDFSAETWKWIEDFYRRDPGVRAKLRVHQVDLGREEAIDVHLDVKSWYLHLGLPDATFEIELGLVDSRGKFHSIARSGRVRMPRNGPSTKIDPDWKPENYGEISGLSVFSSQLKRP